MEAFVKAIYFVVNEKDRIAFEKYYEISYGYGKCIPFQYEDVAIAFVESHKQKERNDLIVEKVCSGEVELIYRGAWYEPRMEIDINLN